ARVVPPARVARRRRRDRRLGRGLGSLRGRLDGGRRGRGRPIGRGGAVAAAQGGGAENDDGAGGSEAHGSLQHHPLLTTGNGDGSARPFSAKESRGPAPAGRGWTPSSARA